MLNTGAPRSADRILKSPLRLCTRRLVLHNRRFSIGAYRRFSLPKGWSKSAKPTPSLPQCSVWNLPKWSANAWRKCHRWCVRIHPSGAPVGNDGGGSFGDADQLRRAELAKYQKQERQRAISSSHGHSRSQDFGCRHPAKSRYTPADLDSVSPMLADAAENGSLAKQLLNAPPIKPN